LAEKQENGSLVGKLEKQSLEIESLKSQNLELTQNKVENQETEKLDNLNAANE
jgi:hypothetical protein